MSGAWWHRWAFEDFWCLIWPNAGAMPLCAAFALTWAWLLRDRIGRRLVRWWHRHHEAHLAELAAQRESRPGGAP